MPQPDRPAPTFDEAATYLILPSWMTAEVAQRVVESVEGALEPDAPVLAVHAAEGDSIPDEVEEVAPAVGAALRYVAPYVIKPAVQGLTTVFSNIYNDNRAAQAHYDNRAAAYNTSADRWWAQQMGR